MTDDTPRGPDEPVRNDPPEPTEAAPPAANVAPAKPPEGGEQRFASTERPRGPRIRIGSQRDPYPNRWAKPQPQPLGPTPRPVAEPTPTDRQPHRRPAETAPATDVAQPSRRDDRPAPEPPPPAAAAMVAPSAELAKPVVEEPPLSRAMPLPERAAEPPAKAVSRTPVPNRRAGLTPELEQELEAALGGLAVDEMLAKGAAAARELAPETRHMGRVAGVHRDSVFVELGERNQGVLPLGVFPEPPEAGAAVEVVVHRFNPEEGLYELTVPGGAVDIGNWSDLREGLVVEARITGHNKGGLECEVNHIRGFLPASQVSLYRVDDLAQFVGQHLNCVVTEANREARNLVLSRRAVLEREQAEAKQKLLAELAPGQVREGVVRSLQPFGAFVDLGGVDGLIHISQLSWERLKHASEALEVGQKVKVKIAKIDPVTRKISLGFRDLSENPWSRVAEKYPVGRKVSGTVTRLMEFGAFVRLEPGVEGLIHISELSHKRVWRASDAVQEGQEVEVQIVSVDPQGQRIGLSLKALEARPAPEKKSEEPAEEAPAPATARKRSVPLKGGLGRSPGGDSFGLRW